MVGCRLFAAWLLTTGCKHYGCPTCSCQQCSNSAVYKPLSSSTLNTCPGPSPALPVMHFLYPLFTTKQIVQVYGVAFASAISAGGEEADALASATAVAFCKGGSTALAFAKAYSAILSTDKNGCTVLTEARALAVAQCSGGVFRSYSEASVTQTVLGLCGIAERFGLDPDTIRRITSGQFRLASG